MGYGNCILALDTVFNSEVLGGTGLLFSRDSAAVAGAMRRIEGDPTLVESLRRGGPQRIASEYTWDKISAQYDALFREVAAS
jgi:glycosyltransferase involved in cell wall biosynthesis